MSWTEKKKEWSAENLFPDQAELNGSTLKKGQNMPSILEQTEAARNMLGLLDGTLFIRL